MSRTLKIDNDLVDSKLNELVRRRVLVGRAMTSLSLGPRICPNKLDLITILQPPQSPG